jgi:hypothetical protein
VKNKRPGGGLVDDIDMEIDGDTGRLYPIPEGELPNQYLMALQADADARRRAAMHAPAPVEPTWEQQEASF